MTSTGMTVFITIFAVSTVVMLVAGWVVSRGGGRRG